MDKRIQDTIEQTNRASLEGSLSFPQVVQALLNVGVSRYHIDFERAEKTSYLRSGETHVEPVPMPKFPIAQDFNADGVAAAVQASQTQNQTFPDFLKRAFESGCVGYLAYLDGRRVVYTGRQGDEHVERFPS